MWWLVVLTAQAAGGAVLAPPWADARRNPCAASPRGWLTLYWPQDGQCYPIYKKGYPCPETQELSPGVGARGAGRAVCSCPPGTARLPPHPRCHSLFGRGPCARGEYFAPVEESFNRDGERWGTCVRTGACADESQVFWPKEGRCYPRHSHAVCHSGTILDADHDGLGTCTCREGGAHWAEGRGGAAGGCYEHYSQGPCESGQLFLPGGVCGCQQHLPHFHNQTNSCYQIDRTGPCPRGHTFSITEMPVSGPPRASCVCKPFHALHRSDGACYRFYTRGPCRADEMISRSGRCVKLPCAKGRLYFPERRKCYKPGSPEPCPEGEVATFDFDARPSVDGVSHNGKCSCGKGACGTKASAEEKCSARPGMAVSARGCHMVYTQGPCGEGSWLVPGAQGGASCVCRPGYEGPDCVASAVRLAKYLNQNSKVV